MTDISFPTESVTGVDHCGKEIVGIDLPKGCLGTEFNLLTYYEGVLGMVGASGVTAPRALALSGTPKKPHTSVDPPLADTADEPAPAPAAPAPTDPAPAGSAGAQEPAPAASPPKACGKGGVRARGSGK